MNEKMKPLGTRESAFAAEHHDLVTRFLAENRLKEDEYYDIVVFGFLNAVRKYLRRPQLQDYSFTTIAWKAMNTSLGNERRSAQRQNRKAVVYSLQESWNDGYTLEETVADVKNSIEEAIGEIELEDTLQAFDANEQRICSLLAKGYLKSEVAEMVGLTPSALTKRLRVMQNKASVLIAA